MRHHITGGSLKPERLSELIGLIYDCALFPTRWDDALLEIAQALDCEKAILSLNDLGRDRLPISKSVGWEPFWLAERSRHLPEIHAVLSEWLAGGPRPDTPFVASREISARGLAESPYVQRCLRPQGIVDIAHFFLITTPTYFSEVVLARDRRQGSFGEREIALGALLLPHLRRAVTINDMLDMKSLEQQALAGTLDSVAAGVVIVADQGRILHANGAARQMLDESSPIASSHGCLAAPTPRATRELLAAITLAQADEAKIGHAGIGVPLLHADVTATAHVLPLMRGDATAAVFVVPDGTVLPAELGTVARAFGLTPAETRQLEQLIAGATLGEAAAALHVSEATARTHREHIFAKMGVSRRGDLVALVSRLIPPIRRPNERIAR